MKPEEIEYPESDGRPRFDDTLHCHWLVLIENNYELLYCRREDVFVAGDLFWYPVEGHPEIRTAPDVLVALGRPRGDRGSYRQWQEGGQPPQVVWEITSPGNGCLDLDAKWDFYQRYGVQEYYLVEYYLHEPDRMRLRGWLRRGKTLQEIEAIERGWTSPLTGVRMEMSGGRVRLFHPNGEPFRSYSEVMRQCEEAREAEQKREAARAQAEQERQLRKAAEARAEQLAARLRELGIDPDV